MRVCAECGETKPLDAFVAIKPIPLKRRPGYVYSRCRVCRNRRARERYRSSPEIRAAEIARATRNRLRRRVEGGL